MGGAGVRGASGRDINLMTIFGSLQCNGFTVHAAALDRRRARAARRVRLVDALVPHATQTIGRRPASVCDARRRELRSCCEPLAVRKARRLREGLQRQL